MLGSAIINQRQHVGLQKLSALAGITNASLGPNKKYKFIQDGTSGESALACSCFRIFENLELTCAVGQLVYETLQAHQKVYHTGSGCLLFLAGAWSRAALECLQRGISVTHIISAMSEGIDVCLKVCSKISISTEAVGEALGCTALHSLGSVQLSKNPNTGSQTSNHLQGTSIVAQKTQTTGGQRKIKLSRHFYEVKFDNMSTLSHAPQPKSPDIELIAERLSHGAVDAMNLVVKASRVQSKNNQQDGSCSTFDVSKVMTCVLPSLPEEHACVLPGSIFCLSDEQASVAHHLKEQDVKVALITGELSHSFRHIGFSRPTGTQHVSDHSALMRSSKEDVWVTNVEARLLNLEVNLILVSGLASEKVIQRCCRQNILVVENVKASVLKTFANVTGAVPVTYATQLSKECVGSGVTVVLWRDLSGHQRRSSTAVNISTAGNCGLVTVVLTSCVQGKLQALEDQFWGCAYRLHHALKDGAILPGAGVTELLCIHQLQQQAEQQVLHRPERSGDLPTRAGTAANHYRGVVLHLMAEGLIDYISTVMVNTGRFSKLKARTLVSQNLQNYYRHADVAAMFSHLLLEGEQEDSLFFFPLKSDQAGAVKVNDNISVKQEVWRKALDVVFLVLQTDAELITGIDQETAGAKENLLLL